MYEMFTVSKSFINVLLCFPYERNNAPALSQTPKGQIMGVWTQLDLPSWTGGCLQWWMPGAEGWLLERQTCRWRPSCHQTSLAAATVPSVRPARPLTLEFKGGSSGRSQPAAWDLFSAPCLRRRPTIHSEDRASSCLPCLQEDLRGLRALPCCCGNLLNPRTFKQDTVVSETRRVLVKVLCQEVSN